MITQVKDAILSDDDVVQVVKTFRKGTKGEFCFTEATPLNTLSMAELVKGFTGLGWSSAILEDVATILGFDVLSDMPVSSVVNLAYAAIFVANNKSVIVGPSTSGAAGSSKSGSLKRKPTGSDSEVCIASYPNYLIPIKRGFETYLE